MRRLSGVAFLAALMLIFSATANAESFDVRKVRWGMSRNDVKGSENPRALLKEVKEDSILIYQSEILSNPTYIMYGFNKSGKLDTVTCSIRCRSNSDMKYVYSRLASSLSGKYKEDKSSIDVRAVMKDQVRTYTTKRSFISLIAQKDSVNIVYMEISLHKKKTKEFTDKVKEQNNRHKKDVK